MGWPWTQRFLGLWLPSAGMRSACCHSRLLSGLWGPNLGPQAYTAVSHLLWLTNGLKRMWRWFLGGWHQGSWPLVHTRAASAGWRSCSWGHQGQGDISGPCWGFMLPVLPPHRSLACPCKLEENHFHPYRLLWSKCWLSPPTTAHTPAAREDAKVLIPTMMHWKADLWRGWGWLQQSWI